ncbi:MAG: AMP-binding protein [Acidimicrobiales bacterium]|nr:AMP-binding protein [Acidimicrobiales bacterium]
MNTDLHFATAWEAVARTVPDKLAVVQGSRRLDWREFDDQAARLAGALRDLGVQPGSKVALMLFNDPEHLVIQHATFKVRGVPVNVNYRYLHNELCYLLRNSGSEILFFDSALEERVRSLRQEVPTLRHLVAVRAAPSDGALCYADLLGASPEPPAERCGDDLYLMYTGGTTGMPKGVMYPIGEFCAAQYARDQEPDAKTVTRLADIPEAVLGDHARAPCVSIPASPLVHGMGMWAGAMRALNRGGTVVLLEGRSFDADELWKAVEREHVMSIALVGDPFARPMLRALEEAEAAGRPYDIASVKTIVSSGVVFSRETKEGLLDRLAPGAEIRDSLGSTEGGAMGTTRSTRTAIDPTGSFQLLPGAKVLDQDGAPVAPGSGVAGAVAGRTLAFGYYGDPELSARTFQEIDGVRYAVAGDWATMDADGSMRLLGRGSHCINSRGEKVYPQEVEAEIKAFEGVEDCLVVGVPDERGGERVAALVALEAGARFDPDALTGWLHGRISGYKIPRQLKVVERISRADNGKADYAWGRAALGGSGL